MSAGTRVDLAGLRVLVVEDEFMLAEYFQVLLEEFGCEVVGPVATIPAAIAKLSEAPPDCVMLDANLRGKSSEPIAMELHAHGIPFLVVTGYSVRDLKGGLLSGAPQVRKPMSTGELKTALCSLLDIPLTGDAKSDTGS